jgi:hypothetical protein
VTKIVCPCCLGAGEIEQQSPVHLSTMQLKIYDIVRRSKHGIVGEQLINKVYEDRRDGGPICARLSVHVQISNMNKRLAVVGQRVKATARGRGSVYKLERLA